MRLLLISLRNNLNKMMLSKHTQPGKTNEKLIAIIIFEEIARKTKEIKKVSE